MKTHLLAIVLLFALPAIAEEQANPFIPHNPDAQPKAIVPGMVGKSPSEIIEYPLATDSRAFLDNIEIIGRDADAALLRIPISGGQGVSPAGTQAMSFKSIWVKNGTICNLGGRTYRVELPVDTQSVQLTKKGEVLWEGEIANSKAYIASPIAEPTTRPLSAGVGIGQTASGSQSQSIYGK